MEGPGGQDGREGQEGRDGLEGQEEREGRGAALLACLLLLCALGFARTMGEWAQPAQTSLDCDYVAVTDTLPASPARPAPPAPPADVLAMERCLTIRPDDVELMADLGAEYERAGRFDRAEVVYRQALAADADDGDLRVRLGRVLLRRDDVDGARREGAAAAALQPGRAEPLELVRDADGRARRQP